MSDCIFCRIASGEIPATIVARTPEAVAFRDLNPQAPTHVLVIPVKHFAGLDDVAGAEGARQLAAVTALAVQVAKQEGLSDDGYRVVFNSGANGGQSVYHLHAHVLGGRKMSWPPG
jgi:histidine triad (HIT) family protein